MRARKIAAIALPAPLLLTAGCQEATSERWLLEELRVLAVRAEPAEAPPGAPVALDALVVDPLGAGRPVQIAWALCTPDPAAGAASCGEPGRTVPLTVGTAASLTVPAGALHVVVRDGRGFRGKRELFRAVGALLSGELRAAFDEPVPGGLSLAQRLELLLLRLSEGSERRRRALDLLAAEPAERLGDAPLSPSGGGREQLVRRLEEWLDRNTTAAELGGIGPGEASRLLLAVSSVYLADRPAGRKPGRSLGAAVAAVQVFLHGVRGLTGGTPPPRPKR